MAQSTGASATDQAQQRAQEAAGQAKDKAQQATQQATQQAKSQVSQQVDQRSTQAGEQVSNAAQAIREAAQSLREKGSEPAAKGLETVADRVEGVGGWLSNSDGDRILHDVEGFGRRTPLAVIAVGATLGFAASRLLKASSQRRYDSGLTSSGPRYGDGSAQLPPAGGTTPGANLASNGVTGGTPPTGTGYDPRSQANAPGGSWMGEVGGEGEGTRPVR